jgi:outer membrane receptor for ferrienterochelin and colicins
MNAVVSYSYFNRVRNNYVMNLVTLDRNLSGDMTRHDTTVFDNMMFRAFYTLPKFNESTAVQFGTELNYDRVIGERIEGPNGRDIENYAAFVSVEQELGDLKIQPALRYIYNSRYEAPLVPSLNMRYGMDDITIRASVAQGFRSPSIKELYLLFVDVNHNIQGNENLQAETSFNASMSMDWQMLMGEGEDVIVLKVSPNAFYNDISDQITLAQDINDPTLFSYFNLADFQTMGAGLEVGLIGDNFSLSASYLYMGQSQRLSGNDMFFTNELGINASYDITAWDLSLASNTKFNGARVIFLDGADQILEGNMPSFISSDASIRYDLTGRFSLTGGVRNIFNVTNLQTGLASGGVHSAGSSMPIAWGRTFYLGFSFN